MPELLDIPVLRPDENRKAVLFKDLSQDVREAELARVEMDLATEREWLEGKDGLLLPTKATIISAIETGDIVPVPYDQPHFMPTYEFVNRQTQDQLQRLSDDVHDSEFSVPFLRPGAASVLQQICSEAYAATVGYVGMPVGVEDFRFAVSSMTRSRNYQKSLVSSGVLAADPEKSETLSTHAYGLAFDIDHSGIYVKRNGNWDGVGIGRQEDQYMPGAIDELANVLQKFQEAGIIHTICEVPSGRGSYHVAVNPNALQIGQASPQ